MFKYLSLINHIKNKLKTSQFVRHVSVLTGGTAVGQIITIISIPILTRLYTPESFSSLALYISVLTILSSVSGLCFEYAIPLTKSPRIAAALTILTMVFVSLTTLICIFLVLLIPGILNIVTSDKLTNFLWLIPLGIFFIGLYNSLQYWCTRNKEFTIIAKTKIRQSFSGNLVKLISGYFMGGWTTGLIFGQLVSQGAGFISLGTNIFRNDLDTFKKTRFSHIVIAFKRYIEFPKFTTLEVFANNGGIQIPIILIVSYAAGPEAGYLMVAMQIMSIPINLVGRSVAQVYLSEGAIQYRSGYLNEFTVKTIKSLALVSAIPLLTIAIISPYIMPYLLGDNWARTGQLLSWLTPWFFIQFITSPVSTALYITSNQKIAFLLQLAGLIIRVGCVFIAIILSKEHIVEFYAVSGVIFYSLYLFTIMKIIKKQIINKVDII